MEMMNTPLPHVRRPQAERSATTRAKLIEAAINCLHRQGYSLTGTSQVAEEAGVSRGAMLHQFPTKTDLMLAVVRAVFERDSEHYRQTILTMTPRDWMRGVAETVWEVVSRPSGIAVMEIMLASRADPELAEKLRAIQLQIDDEAHTWVSERRLAAGLENRPDSEAIHRLFVAAARGLAMEQLFMNNRGEIKKSIDVLSEILYHFYPQLAESGAADAQD